MNIKHKRLYFSFHFALLLIVNLGIAKLSNATPNLVNNFDNLNEGPVSDAMIKHDWPSIKWSHVYDRASIISVSHTNKALKVRFPKGSVGPSQGGASFVVELDKSKRLTLSYKLKFEKGFDFRLGGKLPGLSSGGSKYTGGVHPDTGAGWSARYMWRKGGQAVLYLYYIDMQGKWGENLPLKGITFKENEWIELTQEININDPDKKNASIKVWANGTLVMEKSNFRLRLGDQGMIDSFYFSTFHGGNTADWAPINDSSILFDDFLIK